MIRIKAFDQKTESFYYVIGFTIEDMEKLLNCYLCELRLNNGLNFMFFGGVTEDELKNNIRKYCQNGDKLEFYMNEETE